MKTTLSAQPYDRLVQGFRFTSAEEFKIKAAETRDGLGQPIEEFGIQFVEGSDLDSALARAWTLDQGNFTGYFEAVETWDIRRKQGYIISVGGCGYSHEEVTSNPATGGVEILPASSLLDYARHLVADGAYGEIPEPFRKYVDYWRIATDLSTNIGCTIIAGERVLYSLR